MKGTRKENDLHAASFVVAEFDAGCECAPFAEARVEVRAGLLLKRRIVLHCLRCGTTRMSYATMHTVLARDDVDV